MINNFNTWLNEDFEPNEPQEFQNRLDQIAKFWDLDIKKFYRPGCFGYAALGKLPSGKEMVLKLTTDYNEAKIANYLQKRSNYSRLVNYFDIRKVFLNTEPLNMVTKLYQKGEVYALLMEKLESFEEYFIKNKINFTKLHQTVSKLIEKLEISVDAMMEKEFDEKFLNIISSNRKQALWYINEMKLIIKDLYNNKFISEDDLFMNDITKSNLGIRYTNQGHQIVLFDIRNDTINTFNIKRKPIILNT